MAKGYETMTLEEKKQFLSSKMSGPQRSFYGDFKRYRSEEEILLSLILNEEDELVIDTLDLWPELLEHEYNHKGEGGMRPLHLSLLPYNSRDPNCSVAKALIDRRADINAATKKGATPLSMAGDNSNAEEIILMLAEHPDLEFDFSSNQAQDILYAIVINGKRDAAKIFLEKGTSAIWDPERKPTGSLLFASLLTTFCTPAMTLLLLSRLPTPLDDATLNFSDTRFGPLLFLMAKRAMENSAHYSGYLECAQEFIKKGGNIQPSIEFARAQRNGRDTENIIAFLNSAQTSLTETEVASSTATVPVAEASSTEVSALLSNLYSLMVGIDPVAVARNIIIKDTDLERVAFIRDTLTKILDARLKSQIAVASSDLSSSMTEVDPIAEARDLNLGQVPSKTVAGLSRSTLYSQDRTTLGSSSSPAAPQYTDATTPQKQLTPGG